jgi:hypothetical protein
MTLGVLRLRFSIDPLIAEAKRRMRRRRLLIVVALVLAGAATAAGVLAGGSPAGPFGQVARSRARQLLNQLVLPPGAQRLRVPPRGDGGLLDQAQSIPGARQLIDLHRIWRVHRTIFSTTSFVENHLPRDAHGEGSGAAGGPGIPPNNQDFSYSLPTGGSISVYWLDLVFVALPHGWTGIRADALVGSGTFTHGGPP